MTRGNLWIDHVWPVGLGFLIAVAYVSDGGGAVAPLTGPALGWCVWQLGRWGERWVKKGGQ